MTGLAMGLLLGFMFARVLSKYGVPVLDSDRTAAAIEEEAFLHGYDQGYRDGERRITRRYSIFGPERSE